jgi:tRNA G18 (ribose-2'-O)-methylase SpoU
MCDVLVEIPNFGSVRSMNVGVAASIAMHDHVSKKMIQ